MLRENEQLDDLQLNGLKIIQNVNKFRFGTDAVLLSYYVKVKAGGKCVDLGTGTGIIPLLLSAKTNAAEIIGVEVQKDLCEMAVRSIKINGLSIFKKDFEFFCADIKNRFGDLSEYG